MIRIRLQFSPSLGSYLRQEASDWIRLEREAEDKTTVGDILHDLAAEYPPFREGIFDPDIGEILQRVHIVHNDRLLAFPEAAKVRLRDGDRILFLPVYTGG